MTPTGGLGWGPVKGACAARSAWAAWAAMSAWGMNTQPYQVSLVLSCPASPANAHGTRSSVHSLLLVSCLVESVRFSGGAPHVDTCTALMLHGMPLLLLSLYLCPILLALSSMQLPS